MFFSYQEWKNLINSKTEVPFYYLFCISWYQKSIFDIKKKCISWYEKKIDDIKKINPISWYKKINPITWYQESIFWYQEMDFFKSKHEVLISRNRLFISRNKLRINSKATPHTFSRLFSSGRHPAPTPPLSIMLECWYGNLYEFSTTFKTILFTGKQHVAVIIRFEMYMYITLKMHILVF